ncbi:MAG: hypothetical protein KGY51_11795 [Psychroflexus sp.]|nr:hypothetical protein [Psychroflexus sp.]
MIKLLNLNDVEHDIVNDYKNTTAERFLYDENIDVNDYIVLSIMLKDKHDEFYDALQLMESLRCTAEDRLNFGENYIVGNNSNIEIVLEDTIVTKFQFIETNLPECVQEYIYYIGQKILEDHYVVEVNSYCVTNKQFKIRK